jgi:cofilin
LQASGVGVHPKCIDDFQQLKLKKVSKYIVFGLNDNNTEIVVKPFDDKLPSVAVSDDEQKLNPHYAEFRSQLPADQCRYGVYDLAQEKEGAVRNKLVFFYW